MNHATSQKPILSYADKIAQKYQKQDEIKYRGRRRQTKKGQRCTTAGNGEMRRRFLVNADSIEDFVTQVEEVRLDTADKAAAPLVNIQVHNNNSNRPFPRGTKMEPEVILDMSSPHDSQRYFCVGGGQVAFGSQPTSTKYAAQDAS